MPTGSRRPGISAPDPGTADMVAKFTGSSAATSYRGIERLQTAGILTPAGKVKGISIWVAAGILAALDDFADRAGRRNRG